MWLKRRRARVPPPAVRPLTSREPAVRPLTSREPAVRPLTSREPVVRPLTSREPAVCPLTSREPAVCPLTSREPAVDSHHHRQCVFMAGSISLPGAVECPRQVGSCYALWRVMRQGHDMDIVAINSDNGRPASLRVIWSRLMGGENYRIV